MFDFSPTAVSPPTVSTCAVVTEVSLDDAVTLLQNAGMIGFLACVKTQTMSSGAPIFLLNVINLKNI